MVGITAFGAYVPRLRLQREAIAQANAWFDPSLAALARGERSFCNWDEDSVTMAVEAARDATDSATREEIGAICLASTSLPFLDRQNAGIVAEALQLEETLRTMDVTGSQRAGTTGLLSMIDAVKAGCQSAMLVASEHRRTRVGSPLEMLSGDAAAALVLGDDTGIAQFVNAHSVATDFVDHFRMDGYDFDYGWEARWVRDEGYLKLVPAAVQVLLEKAGIAPGDVSHFLLPCAQNRVPATVAKRLGINDRAVVDNLTENCGQTGVAHPILMLAHTLERAAPGERIVLIGFGQGCDALLFEATDAVGSFQPKRGVTGWLQQRRPEDNYAKFQTFNDLVEREYGKRAEADMPSSLSALYRNRKMVNAFSGGRCRACGTVQFPKSVYCVNPECGAADTQEDHFMADANGKVLTWTADRLTFDMNPPAYFGLVEFDGGGRAMMDFTDVDPETFDIDTPVSAHFRIKQIDKRRGFRRYFWKAAPRYVNEEPHMVTGIRDKVVILGMGCSRFGERWDTEPAQLMAEAFQECLQDAGIEKNEIQAAWFASAIESVNVGPSALPLATALRLPYIPVTRVENMCASGTEALRGAAYAVASGAVDFALALGCEKLKDTGYGGLPQRSRGVTNDMFYPNLSAPGSFAQLAAGYRAAHRVNKTDLKRAMAHVSVKSHANGAKNPKAHLRREITEDQAISAPMIAEPIGLYDCCGVSDGAACAIVTRPEVAESLGKKDLVSIKALQLSVSNGTEVGHNSWDGSYLRTTRIASQRAYEEAGIKNPREEISMTEVHDCFSITELVTMEDLGIAREGKAVTDVLDGDFDAAGKVPCQIDGGLKCFGHPIGASGLRMLYELYLQFEGRAGERQLDDPVLGLTHNLGGFPAQNVASVSILGRYGN